MSVLRLGYLHVRVADLEDAKRHFGRAPERYRTREASPERFTTVLA
jgi:hypothetical protein